jgi:hypothetical protein
MRPPSSASIRHRMTRIPETNLHQSAPETLTHDETSPFCNCKWLKLNEIWSGRGDLNARPPAPKAGALPGCATPRHAIILPHHSRNPAKLAASAVSTISVIAT